MKSLLTPGGKMTPFLVLDLRELMSDRKAVCSVFLQQLRPSNHLSTLFHCMKLEPVFASSEATLSLTDSLPKTHRPTNTKTQGGEVTGEGRGGEDYSFIITASAKILLGQASFGACLWPGASPGQGWKHQLSREGVVPRDRETLPGAGGWGEG